MKEKSYVIKYGCPALVFVILIAAITKLLLRVSRLERKVKWLSQRVALKDK